MLSRKDESNPFFCEDDDNDGYDFHHSRGKRNAFDDDDNRLEQLLTQKRESERRQVESTQRSLAMLYESEDVGNKTAEEVVRQGEQLDNVEENLDSINSMTKVTQRHLNNIKSVFGGIKNWFSQKPESPSDAKTAVKHSRLKEAVSQQEERAVLQQEESRQPSTSYHPHRGAQAYMEDTTANTQVDANLDELSHGVSRLKDLATMLGDEITVQNDQIDRIDDKADKSKLIIENQTKQMRRML